MKRLKKWQLVLDALKIGDIELAHRLAIKYEFDQNKQIQKSGKKSGYTYFAKKCRGQSAFEYKLSGVIKTHRKSDQLCDRDD